MLLSGDIDGGDYRIIKSGSENKISVLSRSYLLWVIRGRILDAILNKAVNTLSHLDTLCENASSFKKKGNHKFDLPGKARF